MGIESLVLYYRPDDDNEIEYILKDSNIKLQQNSQYDGQFIFTDNKSYWMDIMVEMNTQLKCRIFCIRIALCNPPTVLNKLLELFVYLKNIYGGCIYFFPKGKKTRKLTKINTLEEQAELIAYYEVRKREFQEYFGCFSAAISADSVFSYIHSKNDKEKNK
ncbi:hypothetical protein FYJ85_22520 [Victivallaceae bacterium BBE-744-WT-12]|uniref:Uncharacterized protein n=1 Tax=Victivallis lenta TaxID=2606640 RepID=A0A844G7F8_9BACT|nr:hypothetical protein [Victivallis lenta]MST99807.1 hypothetical protein [Victivallis lenta]